VGPGGIIARLVHPSPAGAPPGRPIDTSTPPLPALQSSVELLTRTIQFLDLDTEPLEFCLPVDPESFTDELKCCQGPRAGCCQQRPIKTFRKIALDHSVCRNIDQITPIKSVKVAALKIGHSSSIDGPKDLSAPRHLF